MAILSLSKKKRIAAALAVSSLALAPVGEAAEESPRGGQRACG